MDSNIRMRLRKPHNCCKAVWLSFIISLLIFQVSCKKSDDLHKTTLFLKTGTNYTADGSAIPVGGQIRIGVLASGGGAALTYIRIDRISNGDTLTQLDRGIYVGSGAFDADYIFSKDTASTEIWQVTVMNADRVRAVETLSINKGSGSAFGGINYYPSVVIGFQNNESYGHYLDVDQGLIYDATNLAGHESDIDILAYYYVTSGLPSPSLTCPGYTAAVGYYPGLSGWPVKRTTLYDYRSTDNNLIPIEQFDLAEDDSLLVTAYKPDKVSGNCKYCYSGKVVPFKTEAGKYGLIKIIRADEIETGSMEVAIKVQK